MEKLLLESKVLGKHLSWAEIKRLLDAKGHVGNVLKKALTIAKKIDTLKKPNE